MPSVPGQWNLPDKLTGRDRLGDMVDVLNKILAGQQKPEQKRSVVQFKTGGDVPRPAHHESEQWHTIYQGADPSEHSHASSPSMDEQQHDVGGAGGGASAGSKLYNPVSNAVANVKDTMKTLEDLAKIAELAG